jgi:hypothetical protein
MRCALTIFVLIYFFAGNVLCRSLYRFYYMYVYTSNKIETFLCIPCFSNTSEDSSYTSCKQRSPYVVYNVCNFNARYNTADQLIRYFEIRAHQSNEKIDRLGYSKNSFLRSHIDSIIRRSVWLALRRCVCVRIAKLPE